MHRKSMRILGWVGLLLGCSFVLSEAAGIWVKGTITQSPRLEQDGYSIQVNDETYHIATEAPVYKRFERRPGAYDEEKIAVRDLHFGQEVSIRVHEGTILKIIVWE